MCTVFISIRRDGCPRVVVAAVRDEFVDRAWAGPARHWPCKDVVGGRDLLGGGTWLAVAPARHELALVVNGPDTTTTRTRTRGELPIRVLSGGDVVEDDILEMGGFHLLHARPDRVRLVSWTRRSLVRQDVPPGSHTLTHGGLDDGDHPRVKRFRPLMEHTVSQNSWHSWKILLTGLGLDPTGPDALVVERVRADRGYRTSSAALVSLSTEHLRYHFTANPRDPGSWRPVAEHAVAAH
jgi:uncharacterized protein with NRDE domain